MAWRRPGNNSIFEPMMVRLPTHIWVTRPVWVICGILCGTYNRCTKVKRTWYFLAGGGGWWWWWDGGGGGGDGGGGGGWWGGGDGGGGGMVVVVVGGEMVVVVVGGGGVKYRFWYRFLLSPPYYVLLRAFLIQALPMLFTTIAIITWHFVHLRLENTPMVSCICTPYLTFWMLWS